MPAPVDEERAADDEADAFGERFVEQAAVVNAFAEVGPEEEAAARLRPVDPIAEDLVQRRLHHVALVAVMLPQRRRELTHDAALDGGVNDPLIEDAAAQVHRLLGELDARRDRTGRDHPCHPQPGHERFRDAAEIDHASGRIVGTDRPRFGA